jgi:hypothetical protein
VDPGARDLVSCMSVTKDGQEVFWKYSNKEYYHKIRAKWASKKKELWLQKDRLQKRMRKTPTAKTGRVIDFMKHIKYLARLIPSIATHYSKRRMREINFTQHSHQQKVMQSVSRCVTHGGNGVFKDDTRPVVVAFGSALFNVKGHRRAPIKGIRNKLLSDGVEIYLVNEDYTSQLCSTCHEQLIPMRSAGSKRALHSIRRCTTADCSSHVWNRDVNASRNIMHVFRNEMAAKKPHRPEKFTRAFQTAKKDAADAAAAAAAVADATAAFAAAVAVAVAAAAAAAAGGGGVNLSCYW